MQEASASVVVPVYNSEETLEECVESLLSLDYPGERELIFVDNGSTDASPSILERFGARIRTLREPKRGPAAARNRGIQAARFGRVAFIDSDCVADSGWLRHIVAGLSDPAVGATGGAILSRRPCNQVEAFGESIHDNQRSITHYRPPYVASANWASRKDVLERLNGFDETFAGGEDVDFSCRLLQSGLKLAYAPGAVVYHRNERTWGGLLREGFEHGVNGVAVLERHRSFYQSFGYRPGRMDAYRKLWRHVRDYAKGTDRIAAACNLVFDAGKRAGRLVGSLRCGALHW